MKVGRAKRVGNDAQRLSDQPCEKTMKDHRRGSDTRWLAVMVAMALLSSTAAAAIDYAHDDIQISGQELYGFRDAGHDVTVVLGGFQLTFGHRILSGRDAVLWIDTRQMGNRPLHDITVYIEGEARAAEGGSVTTDSTMLVTLHTDGRIRSSTRVGQRDLGNLPLYLRAVEVRQAPLSQEKPPAAAVATVAGPAEPNAKDLVAWAGTSGAKARPKPAGAAPTGNVPSKGSQGQTFEPVPTGPMAIVTPAKSPTTKPAPKIVKPINFSADRVHSEQISAGAPPNQATVLNGHVYLSQGNPDSTQFLELRSDSAVIFTRPAGATSQPAKDARGPLAFRPSGGQMNIEGVYLEGDVIISRGERTFRGPAAYYDFLTDRAVVVSPVFRTVQEQRNIPIYVRAKEARLLSAREAWFKDAKISSSEFYTPSYHMGASTVYLTDTAPYDDVGERLGPASWEARAFNTTSNIAGVPFFYWPYQDTDFTEGHTPLRRLQIGRNGNFGWGVETQWHLFRMLGLIAPEGYKGTLEINGYQKGWLGGAKLDYTRKDYSGYDMFYGVLDRRGEDTFGNQQDNIEAPTERGRVLMRHKQILPQDWELQTELGYVCDRNFMEAYFPAEYAAGKPQETLTYLRQQRDNRAITALLQYRLNRFDTQTESAPDVAFHWIGEPLWGDRLTYYNETRAGIKRYRPDKGDPNVYPGDDSDLLLRPDTRNEIDLPLHAGPFNMVSYATGRATYWSDVPDGGDAFRPYGQIGQRIDTHIWRTYDNVTSRLWDVNRLRHVITPEATAFISDAGGVSPNELYPLDPDIEQHLYSLAGGQLGLRQRLQTKRGPVGSQRTVDWMRFDLTAGFYDNGDPNLIANGRNFWYRPENSVARNNVTGEYSWQISDSTSFLADAIYDTNRDIFGQADAGISIQRDPRVRYYVGWRALKDLDSSLATFGLNYKLTRKYSVSFFEQYDMAFHNGQNEATSLSIIRQLPRWFAGLTFTFIQGSDQGNDVSVMLTLWPEGVPEAQLGSSRMSMLGKSDKN